MNKFGKKPAQPEVVRVKLPKEGEMFGIIEATLGSNRLKVRCQDDKIRTCRIPGKLRKRMWMREGDIILVKPWEIQGATNGDAVWRYRQNEVEWLKRRGIFQMER